MTLAEQKTYCLNLMKTAKACFLSSINQDGTSEIRALLNLRNSGMYPSLKELFERHDGDFLIYLSTNTSSAKVAQVKDNPNIALYYCNPENFQGVMFTGRAELVHDPSVKKALWQKDWNTYYPQGIDDPDYTVIRLKPEYLKAYGNLSTFSIRLGEGK
ncbi:MAG: pyridoxamine 5'-phosphate oxidase family protein [Spirochaetales bacterium]|nr:pyridoxamine 5'-phosphate oxidase family protein [Spirochaetales bacterium]